MAGRTIREAVRLALEALPGDPSEWAVLDRASMRAHVYDFVHDYARHRGVILTDLDIESELLIIVAELLGRKPPEAIVIAVKDPDR
jgi:hypothetical protein